MKQANILLKNCPDENTKKCFENKNVILAKRQSPNLLRQLMSAKFDNNENMQNGIFKCKNRNCKICRLYLVECKSFRTANNTMWEVKTHITCDSKMVLYFQICSFCEIESNVGKTVNLRLRMNNHISACRIGNSTDKFDNHVNACQKGKDAKEPY